MTRLESIGICSDCGEALLECKCPTSSCMVDSVVGLKTGCHYWYRHKHEMIWRICYIGIDHDDNQWLHPIGSPARQLSRMDLDCFDWKLISEPNAQGDSLPPQEDTNGH